MGICCVEEEEKLFFFFLSFSFFAERVRLRSMKNRVHRFLFFLFIYCFFSPNRRDWREVLMLAVTSNENKIFSSNDIMPRVTLIVGIKNPLQCKLYASCQTCIFTNVQFHFYSSFFILILILFDFFYNW